MITVLEAQKDKDKMEEFVKENEKLVWAIIRRNFFVVMDSNDLDDYFQAGMIGLWKAVVNFNPSYNVAFSTYAVPKVIGEIRRYARDIGTSIIKIPRSVLSDKTIIKHEIYSIDAPLKTEGKDYSTVTPSYSSLIQDDMCVEDSVVSKIVFLDMYNEQRPIDQKILYLNSMGLAQNTIAEKVNISQVQVSRILKKMRTKLFKDVKCM